MDSEKRTITVLTEEHIRDKARQYIPLGEKRAFLDTAASDCFEKLEVSTDAGDNMPPLYKESPERKNRYLLAALMKLFLRLPAETEEGNEWFLTEEAYDEAAGSFLLNSLERMKKSTHDKALQDKIYDMIADYKSLEKMLNAECYGLLNAMNDPVSRFQMLMSSQTTPEYVEALGRQFEESRAELDKLLKAGEKET